MKLIKLICELNHDGTKFEIIPIQAVEKNKIIVCDFGDYKKNIQKDSINSISQYVDNITQSIRLSAIIEENDENEFKIKLRHRGIDSLMKLLQLRDSQMEKIRNIILKSAI